MKSFSFIHGTRGKTPRVPFSDIAQKILGSSYELSVAVIGDERMRRLNRTYRKKDETTDILAFPLSKSSGEIVLNVRAAHKKSKQCGVSEKNYVAYIFIHGTLHLKGHEHGRTMERLEDMWCKRFNVQVPAR